MQWISLWLSVPESLVGTKKGNETNVCAYMMRGKNATATNATESRDSCEGIISDECFDEYEAFDRPMNEVQGGRCPQFRSGDRECEAFATWSSEYSITLISHLLTNSKSRPTDKLLKLNLRTERVGKRRPGR
jgi:hypothetical protein